LPWAAARDIARHRVRPPGPSKPEENATRATQLPYALASSRVECPKVVLQPWPALTRSCGAARGRVHVMEFRADAGRAPSSP